MDLFQLLNWPLKLVYFVLREIVRMASGNPRWPEPPPPEEGGGEQ